MAGERRPQLRIVGGNEALARNQRPSREAHWPPLRVVGATGKGPATTLAAAPPVRTDPLPKRGIPKRGVWSRALLAGLLLTTLSSVGQAIAANW